MSKNPLFMLVGTFYRSFQRLYIINLALNLTHHRNFFAFYSFSIIYTVHQKRSSVCANDLLVSGLYF